MFFFNPEKTIRTLTHGGRRRRPVRVAVPYAPTKKGRAAERAAAGRSVKASGTVKRSSGLSLGDVASVVADVATAPGPLAFLGKGPIGDAIRSSLKDSAENAIDVVNESETARLLRGEGPRPGGSVAHVPNKKELQLAADLALFVPGGEAVGLGGKAGKVIQGASDLKTASKLIEASRAAVKEGGAAEKAVGRAWGRGRARAAVGRVAAKAEPAAVKAAREGTARRATDAVSRLPKSVQTAGRVAGRAAALPVKHPFTAPIAAQVPAAAISGDPSDLGKAFTGEGVFANASSSLGDAVASAVPGKVAQNLVKDAFNLPAVALPSAYLPVAGAVEASKGDPSRLEGLLHEYEKSGLLPAVFRGDVKGAAKALENHPLFSALEVSGTAAVAGRGAGAAARAATHGKLGGTERPALVIPGMEKYGDVRPIAGPLGTGGARYSPDLLRQAVQRAADRRRVAKRGGHYAKPSESERALKSLSDRYAYERQQVQRVHRFQNTHGMYEARPKSGRFKTDHASAGVVSLAVQRIIRDPSTFHEDLRTYRAQLEEIYKSGKLSRSEEAANRELVKTIDKGIERADPEAVVRAANAFVEHHGALVDELVSQGLLDKARAEKASAIPFARIHMGADHGVPTAPIEWLSKQLEDAKPRLREEARATLSGHRESVKTAVKRLKYAESGRLQAERTVATLRANLKRELESRKSDAAKVKVSQRLEQAIKTSVAARQRLGVAKAELKETVDAFRREASGVSAKRLTEIKRIEGELAEAKAAPAQIIDQRGNPLTLDQIKSEMQRHGVEAPGFLTHRARTNSAGGAWYRALFPERQSMPKQARTGAAVAHGTYDASYRALVEQAARSQSIVDATGGFDGMIRQFGLPAPHGVTNMSQAHDALRNPDRYGFTPPPDVPLRPIRVAPFLALKRELEAAHEHQGLLNPENSPVLENVASQMLAEATREGAGPVTYVPEALFKRMQEHFRTTTSYEKVAQAANTAFKGAVLPFSPSFYIGNAVDNWMRFALGGHGPSDIMLGRKISKQLPEGARESIIPGAGYGSFKRVQTYRDARQFEGTSLARVARTLHAVRETPGPKQAVNLFDATRDFLLETNSKLFERLPQYGALGKEARRDLQASSGHWHHALMVSDGAMKDLLKGLRNTDKQIQYAKAVEEVFGNWGKNSPFSRHVLTNLVPFWMWARASTRFVLLTLPAHHPIKVGLLAAAAEMTEDERKKFGLDKFADEAVPGYLQGNVPLAPGITRNLNKYTSFGTFSDYPEFLGRMFFAQGSSPLQALQGLDWKGDRLAKADGSPASDEEKVWLATLTGAEQFIPGFNLIQGAAGGEAGKFNPVAAETGEKLDYLRKLSKMQQISVPVSGESSGSGSSWGSGRQESTSSSWGAGR